MKRYFCEYSEKKLSQPNKFQYNRWQRKMCTAQLYFDVTSVNSVFVSDKIIKNSDNFRMKTLSNIKVILRVQQFLFIIIFIKSWKTNVRKFCFPCYLTLETSCMIGPFLCCHLLYLITDLVPAAVLGQEIMQKKSD